MDTGLHLEGESGNHRRQLKRIIYSANKLFTFILPPGYFMKATLCGFILLLSFYATDAQTLKEGGLKVKPQVDQRIELTSIVARLAGYGEYYNNNFKIYADDVDRHFAKYKNHRAVEFAKQVREKNGIGFDAVPNLAVHLNPPPQLTPRVEFSGNIPDPRWGKADAEKFAGLLREFYRDAECEKFFAAQAAAYRFAERRFETILDAVNFAWYKNFYGEQPAGTFNLYIGLLNGGGNYGARVALPDSSEDLYAVMGTWQTDEKGFPLYGDDVFPTVIHEYNHSFVNKIVEKNAAKFEKSGTAMLRETSEQMRRQGYNHWKTIIIESLVRACVVKYLQRNPTGKMTAQLQLAEEESRSFWWTTKLVALLDEYERNRKKYPTLDSFTPRLVEFFDGVPAQIPALKKSFAQKLPKIVRVEPFPNKSVGVDETVREIRIVFDREMLGTTAFYPIDAKNPFVAPPVFDKTKRILTGKIKIEPKNGYGLALQSFAFRSTAGYSLAEDFILYFTTKGFVPPPPDPNFGYRIENGLVIFTFEKPLNITTEIESVAVAGEFNDWNPKVEGFKLNKTADNIYQLTVKAESLGKPGEKKQFKFVVNETFWIEPAKHALNVVKDAQGNANLFIELKY
jgi:hypothetical protein